MKRMLLPLLVSIMPLNGFRVFLYRVLFGYKIGKGVRIGFGTLICVQSFEVGAQTMIGPLNIFKGPIRALPARCSSNPAPEICVQVA